MHTEGGAALANAEQAALWNGSSGQAWIDAQALLDQMFAPFERRLAETVAARGAACVLDVGCGTGSTTLAAAARVAANGRCVGIDISEPMLAVARARRERIAASFRCADAQTFAFESGAFDLIVSRFGVMFFDDPAAAFANLRRAAADGAALHCYAWRGADENPFMTMAERAAQPLLPALPARAPDAPGQFAFADRARVAGILAQGGWSDIDIQPVDVPCRFPASALVDYFSRLGPLGRALQGVDGETRAHVVATVRAAFAPYVHGDEVQFTAACWLIAARARKPGGQRHE